MIRAWTNWFDGEPVAVGPLPMTPGQLAQQQLDRTQAEYIRSDMEQRVRQFHKERRAALLGSLISTPMPRKNPPRPVR